MGVIVNNGSSSGPSSSPATQTVAGTVLLGAFCYKTINSGTVVVVPAGMTMLQAGDLNIQGDIDLTQGDICWVD